MNQIPILSIIIPCYNSEKFIGSTVEMLLRQDLSDCELILVNDGSTDDTLLILQKYESAENNILVIDQPNRGVSAARNTGMLAAHGRYIAEELFEKETLLPYMQLHIWQDVPAG